MFAHLRVLIILKRQFTSVNMNLLFTFFFSSVIERFFESDVKTPNGLLFAPFLL